MLLNIIFSYNRAMQLDYLLSTTLNRFKDFEFETIILYHTTGDHTEGYKKLIDKYKKYSHIKFVKRIKSPFDPALLKTIHSKKSFNFFLEKSLMNKKSDLFKSQLEKIIRQSKHQLVMFNTDDGIFYKDFFINSNILKIFETNPKETSYRLYVGDNLSDFPDFVNQQEDYYQWDYYAEKKITHWTYPFSVDGTIYDAKNLLKILKKVPYHNPITLEGNVVDYVMENKLLRNGLGPLNAKLVGTILNRVSVDTSNPTLDIKIDFLNKKYLEGYEIVIRLPEKLEVVNIVPPSVSIIKNGIEELIYSLDEDGQKVQQKYSIEGSQQD